MDNNKRHIWASIGTVLFMALIFLLLWFIRLYSIPPETDEVEIEFVDLEEQEEPAMYGAAYAEEETNPAPAAPASPAQEVATDPNPGSAPEHIVSEEETLALERARKEQEEREAAERARKKKEAEAIARAQQMGGLFGKTEGTNTEGDGSGQGTGQKGNPVGHGSDGGGNSWSLTGRGIRGTLPQPSNNFKQEGKVMVQIRVNAAGQVVNATVTGGDVSDKQTRQLALDAARKAKFTEGDHDQIGTITYIFKLN
jgi:TonB family protein